MLSREESLTLFMCLKRKKIRSYKDVRVLIANYGYNRDPDSDIARLLNHIINGTEESVSEIKRMLSNNPNLLNYASDVTTPAGLKLVRIKPYEAALGTGDPGIAEIIAQSFNYIEYGDRIKARQDDRFLKDIKNMLRSVTYDFKWIIQLIKDAPISEVNDELRSIGKRQSPLSIGLETFRHHFSPENAKWGRMHCNYANIVALFKLINDEHNNLNAHTENSNRLRLASCQLFGFLERNLPAIEQMALANTFKKLIYNKAPLARSHDNSQIRKCFQAIIADPQAGLGFDRLITISWEPSVREFGCINKPLTWFNKRDVGLDDLDIFKKHLQNKQKALLKVIKIKPNYKPNAKPTRRKLF